MPLHHHFPAYCDRCGARLVPAMSGLVCPRLNSCARGGLLEGTGVELVHHGYVSGGDAVA